MNKESKVNAFTIDWDQEEWIGFGLGHSDFGLVPKVLVSTDPLTDS
jgi:hypothetical protein